MKVGALGACMAIKGKSYFARAVLYERKMFMNLTTGNKFINILCL